MDSAALESRVISQQIFRLFCRHFGGGKPAGELRI
jgi:hypothetical protein